MTLKSDSLYLIIKRNLNANAAIMSYFHFTIIETYRHYSITGLKCLLKIEMWRTNEIGNTSLRLLIFHPSIWSSSSQKIDIESMEPPLGGFNWEYNKASRIAYLNDVPSTIQSNFGGFAFVSIQYVRLKLRLDQSGLDNPPIWILFRT